jgi:hypothetical protein
MAKVKKDHVLIGKTFTKEGQLYRVQDVQVKIVYASKMIDDKTCQRGRPSKFDIIDVVNILGISLQTLEAEAAQAAKPVIKVKLKPEEIIEEDPPIPAPKTPTLTEEELEVRRKSVANLIAMFPPDERSTSDDW